MFNTMADEKQARDFVGFRIGKGGLAAVDNEATSVGASRSQMIRLVLALGLERWRAATPAQRRAWRLAHGLIDKSPG
jgi:hypothetical protein